MARDINENNGIDEKRREELFGSDAIASGTYAVMMACVCVYVAYNCGTHCLTHTNACGTKSCVMCSCRTSHNCFTVDCLKIIFRAFNIFLEKILI